MLTYAQPARILNANRNQYPWEKAVRNSKKPAIPQVMAKVRFLPITSTTLPHRIPAGTIPKIKSHIFQVLVIKM